MVSGNLSALAGSCLAAGDPDGGSSTRGTPRATPTARIDAARHAPTDFHGPAGFAARASATTAGPGALTDPTAACTSPDDSPAPEVTTADRSPADRVTPRFLRRLRSNSRPRSRLFLTD